MCSRNCGPRTHRFFRRTSSSLEYRRPQLKEPLLMTRLIESKKICVTMFLLFVLAILVNTLAGGTLPTFGSSPVLTPDVQQELQAEDSPFFPPDIELARVNTVAGGTQELLAEDSPFFPPDIELA